MSVAHPMDAPSIAGPLDGQVASPKKVAIFVEPSPFSHISGMKNRFECLIKGLRDEGDEVLVVTPCSDPPKEFCGAKVRCFTSASSMRTCSHHMALLPRRS